MRRHLSSVTAVLPRSPLARPWIVPVLFLLILLALHLAAAPVRADGIIIPEPPPRRPITWRDVPLAIRYHRVDVTIDRQVATTHVDQVFRNEADYAVEGTYIFPLPEDAAISSFDMWVDGQKLEGRLLGRDEARAIYEEIVRKQRDPALLEYVGRGAFQASIFPIPPGGERRIELTYSQVLAQAGGLVHYRYPLNTEKFSARDIAEVAVTVRLKEQSPLRAIYSPSHAVQVVREGGRSATISYEARDVRPDRDFDLYYSLSPEAIAVNLLSYKPFDEDGFFLLLVTPPVEASRSGVVAKDVVLVLDTSGSMDGEKLEQAKRAADYVLANLGESDRFNIVAFSSATRLFADRPVSRDRELEAHGFIRELTAQGSTDINRALLEALAGADPERPMVIIFLTDGLPTAGETDPDRIVANVAANAPKSVRLFAFGVGYDVDTVLLDQLSANQRGVSAYVRPGQVIDEEVSGFYAKVSAPVLVDVQVQFSAGRPEDMYPYPLPDLFAGNQLIVAGRYREGGPVNIALSGSVNGQPQKYVYRDLELVSRGGNEFIPRLWAQRKIGYLLTQIRLQGARDELVKEVVALSTRYGIVTPYTSFLVEEPALALSPEGRDQLGRVMQGAPGAGGGPAAAPSAVTERAGEAAVEKAVAEQELAQSEHAALPSAGETLRQAGDKTFLFHEGGWVDTAFDAGSMKAKPIPFGSDAYFDLLAAHPEVGRYLALGDRVTVVIEGVAYAVTPAGASEAPSPTSPPVASVASPEPVAAEPEPVPALQVTPVEPQQPLQQTTAAATSPAPAAPATPGVCPGAAAVGLLGLAAPVWAWRRRR